MPRIHWRKDASNGDRLRSSFQLSRRSTNLLQVEGGNGLTVVLMPAMQDKRLRAHGLSQIHRPRQQRRHGPRGGSTESNHPYRTESLPGHDRVRTVSRAKHGMANSS